MTFIYNYPYRPLKIYYGSSTANDNTCITPRPNFTSDIGPERTKAPLIETPDISNLTTDFRIKQHLDYFEKVKAVYDLTLKYMSKFPTLQ